MPTSCVVLLLVAASTLTTYAVGLHLTRRLERGRCRIRQSEYLHLATIEALARAIDARDQPSKLHIRRVQVYSTGIARAVGLARHDVMGVRTAALLHDVGKMAVPAHILSKPGPLTLEEFQKVRLHPQTGAEIVATVPFPYPVAPLILSHHERWDGKGYPHGLSGEDIPLGARILTIADYFDAVTTERSYHKALSAAEAADLIRHEAGRAFDPALAAIFIQILPQLLQQAAAMAPAMPALAAGDAATADTPSGVPAPPTGANVTLENITNAHREIYALYDIATSMGTSLGVGDTMALLSSKLSKVVPWTACALFLYQPDRETLTCRYTSGAGVQPLRDTEIPLGQGLPGWVARNRVSLTSGTPALTFAAGSMDPDVELNSAIVCPLNVADTFIGCLALYHTDPHRYTEDHIRLMEQVAEQAGSVVHNSVLFEQTQEDSLTDSLTALPNRRSLFSYLARELARAERLASDLAVIVVDVDDFKAINDTYGHHVGDRALRAVASAIQDGLRSYDLCVRYAGDEFVLVMLGCGAPAAEAKRLELQRRIGAIDLELRFGQTLRLGASAGAAVYPADGATAESLLTRADARMYEAKARRRRRRPEAAKPLAGRVPPAGSNEPEGALVTR